MLAVLRCYKWPASHPNPTKKTSELLTRCEVWTDSVRVGDKFVLHPESRERQGVGAIHRRVHIQSI